MKFIVIDLESYFDDEYTFKKLNTEQYVRHEKFELHGAAIKEHADQPAYWLAEPALRTWLKQQDWSDVFLVSHHAQWDHFALSHHYDVHPKMSGCSLSMSRLLLGNHLSVSLDAVRKHFNMPLKTTPYGLFKGLHWNEMTPHVQQLVAEGACDEVESIWKIFGILYKQFPAEELEVVDTIVKMFSEPALIGDIDMLGKIWTDEDKKKKANLAALNVSESDLQSADRFAQLLRVECVEPETKQGKKKQIYCFAKTDQFMRDLLESEDDRVRTLAEARLGVKSTIMQTRAETLGWMARRGPLCVYLSYSGAGTLRPSGGDGSNFLNLKRRSPIRPALMAPKGHLLGPVDASQIECVAEDQLVLTDNGPKAIQNVTLKDRVWDGVEWVNHEGVVYKGEKQVIFYQGLITTPEHTVYVRSDCGEEKMEMRFAAALARDLVKTNPSAPIRQKAMRQPFVRRLQNLWRTRNKIQIQECARIGVMGSGKFTASELYGRRDRSHRQRWPLRTWQLAIIDEARKCQQSLYYLLGAYPSRAFGHAGFQTHVPGMWLRTRPDKRFSRTWLDGRANYLSLAIRTWQASCKKALQKARKIQAGNTSAKKARVYDIVNAGPRHRFTVSGVLVSNCRVLHYLAGGPDEPVVQKFRNGEDPYVDLSTLFYGEQIYKPKKGDPREAEMEARRGMGKQGRLMCGYGAAGPKFKITAKNGLYGPPVDIPIEDAVKFVQMYRSSTPSVCGKNSGYWWRCNYEMLPALANGSYLEVGPLTIKDHRMYLPNGAMMIYDTLEWHVPEADEENVRDFERNGFWRLKTRQGWKKMWGAKLTQNICEAVSRVIVSQAMLRIKRMGFRTLNWPYDELCLLIPDDGHAEENLQLCMHEMKRTPDWLPGIPLDCEGSLGERYSK